MTDILMLLSFIPSTAWLSRYYAALFCLSDKYLDFNCRYSFHLTDVLMLFSVIQPT